jgi:hypothetical protein
MPVLAEIVAEMLAEIARPAEPQAQLRGLIPPEARSGIEGGSCSRPDRRIRAHAECFWAKVETNFLMTFPTWNIESGCHPPSRTRPPPHSPQEEGIDHSIHEE